MKCKNCGSEMSLDDIDWNFKGNQDNYWLCVKCETNAIEKIRYGKSVKIDWCYGEE